MTKLKNYEIETIVEYLEALIKRVVIDVYSDSIEDSMDRYKSREKLTNYLMEVIGEEDD